MKNKHYSIFVCYLLYTFAVTGPHQPKNRSNLIVVRRTNVNSTTSTTFPSHTPVIDHQQGAGQTNVLQSVTHHGSTTATGLEHSSVVVWLLPTVALLAAILLVVVWLKVRRGKSHHSGHKPKPSSSLPIGRRLSHSPDTPAPKNGHHMPVALRKTLLDQSRFMANPEYDWNGHGGPDGDNNNEGVGDDEDDSEDTSQLAQFKSFSLIRPEWIVLQHEIGEGCFGKVFRGSLLQQPSSFKKLNDKIGQEAAHLQIDHDEEGGEQDEHEPVAVKVLKAAAGPTAQEDLLHEAEIMASFTHPNILALRGIVINGKKNKNKQLLRCA